jgi:nanoRNase/pAp phosphatase (c-di-AMP/oligoRNAs hydrolase)
MQKYTHTDTALESSSRDDTMNTKVVDTEEEGGNEQDKRSLVLESGKRIPNVDETKGELKSVSARFVDDNGLVITNDENGRVIAVPAGDHPLKNQGQKSSSVLVADDDKQVKKTTTASKQKSHDKKLVKTKPNIGSTNIRENNNSGKKQNTKLLKEEIPKPIISGGFNVVLTHCTADFDSLASAVGLAKLWSNHHPNNAHAEKESTEFQSSQALPTFVVLPRGAHPSVNKFLALHKHLFPIRSLRSLPSDLTGLNRLGLVDAQKRERVGPAEYLLSYANRVTIVDHHIEGDSDIPEATDYVVDKVGSVSAMIAEQLRDAGLELTEAEATLLALGIHADTGSLCYDSTTVRDVEALAWVMSQGASQAAIAEHAHSTLSQEQQGVLTNALINTNSTVIHGVTVSTALLRYVVSFFVLCLF